MLGQPPGHQSGDGVAVDRLPGASDFTEFAEIDSPAGISDSADFAFSSCSRANFKREPVSGVDIAVTVSPKVLDLDGRLEKSDILSKHLASAFL